jgi:hypothetical protein
MPYPFPCTIQPGFRPGTSSLFSCAERVIISDVRKQWSEATPQNGVEPGSPPMKMVSQAQDHGRGVSYCLNTSTWLMVT